MIEIIPRKAAPLPLWLKILFYILIALLSATVLSYFILGHFQKKSLAALQNLEEEILEEKTPQRTAQELEVLSYQEKINNFSLMLDRHLIASKFFSFLEKTSHPQIWFSKINLSPGEQLASVSGRVETFSALGQQLQILKKESFVKNVTLSKISLGEKGEIEFTLTLSFDPKFFK
jgi:Tfp pilus assembly protein PilN